VLLDQPGGLRNSRTVYTIAYGSGRDVSAGLAKYARLTQCSTETPGWSALLGGAHGSAKSR